MELHSRHLVNNERTYNQIELFLIAVLDNVMNSHLNPSRPMSLEEHISATFGNADHMDIRDPETLLDIFRTSNHELFSQLFTSCMMAVKTIFSQFNDNGLPIELRTISEPLFIALQHLYPNKFNAMELRSSLQSVPYYMEQPAVRQNTNAFYLTTARVFCTVDHYRQIEIVLLEH